MSAKNKGLVGKVLPFMGLAIFLAVLFLPPQRVEDAVVHEVEYATASMGSSSMRRQEEIGRMLVSPILAVCKDGVYEKTIDPGIPIVSADSLGEWLFQRARACQAAARLTGFRIAGIVMWLPLLLPMIVALVIDAAVERKIRTYRFSFPSPGVNHWARTAVSITVTLMVVLLLAPLPIHPLVLPGLTVFLGGIVWIWMLNLQKKI